MGPKVKKLYYPKARNIKLVNMKLMDKQGTHWFANDNHDFK